MAQLSSDSSLRVYLRDISQTELLTPEEEAELADRVGRGDSEAREHMIRANPVSYTHLTLPTKA